MFFILFLNFFRFYDEDLDETIETISCDKITKEDFEQKYVRQRIPVKIVGCFDESKVKGWSVQNMIDSFAKSEFKFEGSFLSTENNETYRMSDIDTDSVTKMLDKKTMIDVHVSPNNLMFMFDYRYRRDTVPLDHSFMYSLVSLLSSIYPLPAMHS